MYCLAWNAFTQHLLVSSHDTALKVWDSRFPRKSVHTIKGAHGSRITSLSWHPTDETLLLTAGLMNSIKLWNISLASSELGTSRQTNSPILRAKFCPSQDLMAYSSEKREGKIHFLFNKELKFCKSLVQHSSSVLDFDWIPANQQMISLGADSSLKFC